MWQPMNLQPKNLANLSVKGTRRMQAVVNLVGLLVFVNFALARHPARPLLLLGARRMKQIDYNGEGKWTRDGILERYSLYCHQLKISPLNLMPKEHQNGDTKWVYPVMDQVIAGIEKGDAACRQIGIEFLEEDQKFPFGKKLKSNTARVLRRTS